MGIVFTPIGSVDVIVVIANMGYVFMALCCFAAWIQLEKSQLDMPRPYKCPKWLVISEPDSIVHATPENAAIIQSHFEGKDVVVGIGGGTICDLCKYATYYFDHENPLPVVIVQTALSVNAFSDDSSVMLINGVKRTVHSRYPSILIIDLDIVSPASGSEHVMSHLVDMASRVRKTGICYHGTQVAVSGIISEIIWDWLLTEFDPKSVDLEKCYPTLEEMEPKVKAAFDWLDDTHSAAEECWADYQKKLNRWHAHKAEFKAFLENFDAFKATVAPWVKKPEYVVDCMHKATIADEPGNQ